MNLRFPFRKFIHHSTTFLEVRIKRLRDGEGCLPSCHEVSERALLAAQTDYILLEIFACPKQLNPQVLWSETCTPDSPLLGSSVKT